MFHQAAFDFARGITTEAQMVVVLGDLGKKVQARLSRNGPRKLEWRFSIVLAVAATGKLFKYLAIETDNHAAPAPGG